MNRLQIIDNGVIFRNPLPGHRVINAFHPDILPLPNGEWLCVLRFGGAVYSPDGMLEIFRSSDHGKSWQCQGPVHARSRDGGRTFGLSSPLVIWDAYGKESLGVARSATYPSSHDSIAYGAPKITNLDKNHAIASFWCTQGADTHCRWCKIRVC